MPATFGGLEWNLHNADGIIGREVPERSPPILRRVFAKVSTRNATAPYSDPSGGP